ncbi:hypothetical protein QAD02_023935 [Eretmocerus hayati]|uniref:Uncharacterized protein n=1 Tax=Eretmocerus hayati TaxID=131215 RepID=A0ACC2Q247_9HYME|nr:hypothetical protein QAD02_023935 [Eretmocerus hayati]
MEITAMFVIFAFSFSAITYTSAADTSTSTSPTTDPETPGDGESKKLLDKWTIQLKDLKSRVKLLSNELKSRIGIRKKKDKNRYSTTNTENRPFTTESNSEKSSDAGNSLYEAGPSNVRAQVQVEVLDEDHDKTSPETEDELVCEAGSSMTEPEQSCCRRTGMTIID